MEIIRTGACGNSPKNKFVEDFTAALIEEDSEFIKEFTGEDFEFPPGILENEQEYRIEFIFAISHGKFGSLLRNVTGSDKTFYLNFSYIFSNTKGSKINKVYITRN